MDGKLTDVKDEEIFRLQQLLQAAETRCKELETIVRGRDWDGKGISTGANHNEPVLSEEEKLYRRGYSQGFSLCRQYVDLSTVEGLRIGQILRDLHSCEIDIFEWREKAADWPRGEIVKAEWPPDPIDLYVARNAAAARS